MATTCPYSVKRVQDDPNLPDVSGEVPKSERRGWRFNSRFWNILFTWRKNQEPTHCKVRSEPHLASRGSLSKVRPTGLNSWWIARCCILLSLLLLFGSNGFLTAACTSLKDNLLHVLHAFIQSLWFAVSWRQSWMCSKLLEQNLMRHIYMSIYTNLVG